ncbi:MAG: hypothetical protein E7Z62_07970 [Thermoplasmata archaeon]|jgi:hypothetical protein|nr:hypothetical protein [Thermoplasmata archaeon]MBR4244227.1 hypothetical protein [Candidatus Methanomethylophilaceae archaeon]MBR6214610.1 hypothetical protein [Candidatus Methanomethylophilaceae archaeon]
MVALPKEVIDLINAKEATKLLVTVSSEGQPHAIVCGSIFATPDGKAGVGEILMKRASKNLKDTGKAALSVAAGPKAYELILKNPARADSGPVFDDMKAKMAALNLPCFAVWTFDVAEVWDESAGPSAGTKVC